MSKRAERRYHRDRMRAKVNRLFNRPYLRDMRGTVRVELIADNPTVCSGPCCGNPRRWFGELTIQERRHAA